MKFARLDSDTSIYFGRQLEHLKARSYDVKYPMLRQRELIPTSFEADEADKTITYEQYDQVGLAKVIANYASDFPRADVRGKEFTSNIRSLGAAYGYSIQDIRAARKKGVNLPDRKALAARRAVMQKELRIAYFGDPDHVLPGLFTNANVPNVALPADGAGSATTFASKVTTPDLIVRDLNSIANAPIANTNGVETPDTMLLPIPQYTLCASTPRSPTSDTTILSYFLQNNPFIQRADWVNELAAAKSYGFLAADTAWVYTRSPEYLTLEIPSEYQAFEPQLKGMEYEVPVEERCGGTIVYYPLSMAKSDDV